MSTRENLDRFTTPASRALVDQFVTDADAEDNDVDMDEVIRQNLADYEATLTGKPAEFDDDWTALWRRICQVATDQPGAQPDMEPEQFARILAREKRPSTTDLALIADAFGVTVAWLLTGDDHGMCEGTIAALQEELRLGFEHSRRQDEEIADLKQQLLEARDPATKG